MNENVRDVTAQVIIEFTRKLYRALAEKFGGDCTLNEVRVMNQIMLCSLNGEFCNVTGLHKETGIPMPTVSRSVANLQRKGWLTTQQDPDDGRRRIVTLGPRSVELATRDIEETAKWFNDVLEHGLAT
jgi:DNA-binding MarR family transcriptional regulator